jgi:hypothetical protein
MLAAVFTVAEDLGTTNQAGAEGRAAREGASTGALIVNGLTINLSPQSQEAVRVLAQEIDQQRLRTAPAKR